MLDSDLRQALAGYLERLQRPIVLTPSLDASETGRQLGELLQDIAALSPKVSIAADEGAARKPSFTIGTAGEAARIRFAGIPLGHEFTSLVLALLHTGGHPPKLEAEVIERIRALPGPLRFTVYMSLTCQSCPDVVQALNTMAALNPAIEVESIDGALFQKEVDAQQVMAVPTVFLNGAFFDTGRMGVDEILAKLDTGAAAREAAKLADKPPYEMLIVGGGPAGAAAAVYAARKGIRVGVIAERFGGQVMDTAGIENFISVRHTEGPQFGAALEAHVRDYEADVIKAQKVQALVPAAQPGGLIGVKLESGAELQARSLVLATGARWRQLNVPGETELRNRGVAYCPHCDGPLFKGKRVAVVGGGNSGVEAAIDLAGIVSQVTLIEFLPELKADQVLVDKLLSLPNVTILKNTQTVAVHGTQKVSGMRLKDRASGEERDLELEGIFVQIGLVPNTEFLKGTLALSRHGEIEVDARGATNLPGVYAAGDCTTVPFKQIIIAAGEGAKAALAAFDFLIRTPQPA